jgi:hypothetical protein
VVEVVEKKPADSDDFEVWKNFCSFLVDVVNKNKFESPNEN